jgi:septum formation protein
VIAQAQRPSLVLASRSPRRHELLRDLGAAFTTAVAAIDEEPIPGEPAPDYVRRVAREKAAAVWPGHRSAWILAADTTVEIDERILGKPADADAARAMLTRLSGRTHRVLTAVVLLAPGGTRDLDEVVTSHVRFRTLTAAEIERYVATPEPFDKAGAYAIQGHARCFVEDVQGSYTAVVGLPVELAKPALRRRGLLTPRTPTGHCGGRRRELPP